jgi:hypothetical protein
MARSVTAERTQRERDKQKRNAFREFHEGYARTALQPLGTEIKGALDPMRTLSAV